MASHPKPYTSPELVRLAPDDPRAMRLRAELEDLERRAREPKPP